MWGIDVKFDVLRGKDTISPYDEQRSQPAKQGSVVSDPKPRYFVKRASGASRERSVLAGDEGTLFGREEIKPRPQTRRLSAASATRDGFGELVEVSNPTRSPEDLILSRDSLFTLLGIANEFRRGDEIRRHGLTVRSKMLFCGPPGCGKSLCAEVVASELKMPLVVARLDAIIASHLGETATNLRKIFEAAQKRAMVLFLDEFDALARARNDANEHSEIRRVVNSLLMMIDRFDGQSILIAATNLEETVDRAIWRRFDEVVLFDKPNIIQIRRLLRIKTRNFRPDFDITQHAGRFEGMSFAQIERACLNAIKASILAHKSKISEEIFETSVQHELRRAKIENIID
jgi:hypothetical protein